MKISKEIRGYLINGVIVIISSFIGSWVGTSIQNNQKIEGDHNQSPHINSSENPNVQYNIEEQGRKINVEEDYIENQHLIPENEIPDSNKMSR